MATPQVAAALTPGWCSSEALNESERVICASDVLGRLDHELNEVYAAATRAGEVPDQASWLAERNACGFDANCLSASYRTRIAELRDYAQAARAPDARRDRSSGAGEISVAPLPRSGSSEPWLQRLEERLSEQSLGSRSEDAPAVQDDTSLGAALDGLRGLDAMVPRPWCDAGRLNRTERTICENEGLSRLDALLEQVYGRARARDHDAEQIQWLRNQRDTCGNDPLCIAFAYTKRIEELNAPLAQAAGRRHDINIPSAQFPPPGTCRLWFPDRPPGQQPP